MGARSSRKGDQGERELAELLRRHGIRARRSSRMYERGSVAPDVDVPELPLHVEVKRVEALRLEGWKVRRCTGVGALWYYDELEVPPWP